jgi:pilus assembly protein TadC
LDLVVLEEEGVDCGRGWGDFDLGRGDFDFWGVGMDRMVRTFVTGLAFSLVLIFGLAFVIVFVIAGDDDDDEDAGAFNLIFGR